MLRVLFICNKSTERNGRFVKVRQQHQYATCRTEVSVAARLYTPAICHYEPKT